MRTIGPQLCALISVSLPLRSALLLPMRAARHRPTLQVRLCATDAVADAVHHKPAHQQQDEYLIRNDRNDVEVLSCPNLAVLEQGLMELGSEAHMRASRTRASRACSTTCCARRTSRARRPWRGRRGRST